MPEVKRMRYFDNLFLKQEEFNLEQNYHIRMRRLHNRHLHTGGIVWGMEVKSELDTVLVEPGMALCKVKGVSDEDNENEDISQEIILTDTFKLPIGPDDLQAGVYIYIYVKKEPADVLLDRGGNEKIHWVERAIIYFDKNKSNILENDGKVILARIQRDSGSTENAKIFYFDTDGQTPLRTYAGAYGKLTLPVRRSANTDTEPSEQPSIEGQKIGGKSGILVIADTTKFSGKLEVKEIQADRLAGGTIEGDNLKVNKTVNATGFEGNTLEVKKAVSGYFEGEEMSIGGTVKASKFVGDGSGLTGINSGQWTNVAGGVSYNGGNIGIGMTKPEAQVHLSGGNWDLTNSEGDLKIGDGTYRLKIGVAKGGAGAGDVRIRADGGTNRLMLGGGKIDSLTIVQGNVGIGTTIPGKLLHVSSNDGQCLVLQSTKGGDGSTVSLDFQTYATLNNQLSPTASLWVIDDGKYSSHLAFFTKQPGQDQNALIERLRITSEGNVGIGTSSLSEKLEVNGNLKVSGKIIQEDWAQASLINGWENYGDPYNPAGYFLDKIGVVHLRGLVKNGGMNTSIFNLPFGYRPQYRELYNVMSANGASRCDILTTGEVIALSGGSAWFSLDGITFRAKQEFIFIPPVIFR